jgi:hypothetical protein
MDVDYIGAKVHFQQFLKSYEGTQQPEKEIERGDAGAETVNPDFQYTIIDFRFYAVKPLYFLPFSLAIHADYSHIVIFFYSLSKSPNEYAVSGIARSGIPGGPKQNPHFFLLDNKSS